MGTIILLKLLLYNSVGFLNGRQKYTGSKCGQHVLKDIIPTLLLLFVFKNEKELTNRNI